MIFDFCLSLIAAIALGQGVLPSSEFVLTNQQQHTVTASVNQITLIATDVGEIIKYENGIRTVFDYNAEYGKDVSFEKIVVWENQFVALTRERLSRKTETVISLMGEVWQSIDLSRFQQSDIVLTGNEEFVINDILPLDDQLYIACDDGIFITVTTCVKCNILRKPCDFDIKSIEYLNGKFLLKGLNGNLVTLDRREARQNNIQVEAALELVSNGAVFIDVRTFDEFLNNHYKDSINIPLDEFAAEIKAYSPDDTLILYCSEGWRSQKAVEIALDMGYKNVYNLGSIDLLIP